MLVQVYLFISIRNMGRGGKVLLAAVVLVSVVVIYRAMSSSTDVNGEHALMIFGAGTLGKFIAHSWRAQYPNSLIVGVTRHDDPPDWFAGIKVKHISRANILDNPSFKYDYLALCIPPQDNYDGEARVALAQWNSTSIGNAVFSSSAGVFAEQHGGVVTEESKTSDSARTQQILDVENVFTSSNGISLRLAGLFTETRGAHMYWEKKAQEDASYTVTDGDGYLNMIHYSDASSAMIRALQMKRYVNMYLVSDGRPIAKQQIWNSAVERKWVNGTRSPIFTKCAAPPCGKRMSPKLFQDTSGWKSIFPAWDEPLNNNIREEFV